MARLTLDGVPPADLAARWGVPQVGLFRSLPSVLDAVHDLGLQDAPAGTVVIAERQTAGRGREGRSWASPPGGIWMAVLLRPGTADVGVTSIRAGLAVSMAADDLAGRPVTMVKWPNDVLIHGRKLAGVLCEGRWQSGQGEGGGGQRWLAVGIGVNVTNSIPPDLRDRAVALGEVVAGVRRIDVLDRLVPRLLAGQGERLSERELASYGERDWLRGRQLARPLPGRAAGIAPDGALLVTMASGTVSVRSGHVELA